MSLPDSESSKNAFSILMSKKSGDVSPRSRRRSGTEFVVCPAGCGKRMLERDVNLHLDRCIGLQHSIAETSHGLPASQSGLNRGTTGKRKRVTCPACEKAFPSSLINLHLDLCVTRSNRPSDDTSTQKISQQSPISSCVLKEPLKDSLIAAALPYEDKIDANDGANAVSQQSSHETVTKTVSQSPDSLSIFSSMMQQSRAMFAKQHKAAPLIHLRFHLDEAFRVTLSFPMNVENEWTPPSWTASMNIKDRNPKSALENETPQTIELTLSSSIPCYQEPTRWVRRHSRLSVPVLKSIFQKAIRRRKPLPAVRVAMELADKSFGDLLRRLPIIMLEDSTLHPEMNFIVWMMMAYSKDYQPSPQSMMRVFHIVYEIAACQWSDSVSTSFSSMVSEDSGSNASLTSLFSAVSDSMNDGSIFNDTTTMIWSILARAEYGGMKCDVEMLYQFASIWHDRMTCQIVVPDDIVNRMLLAKPPNRSALQWSDIPISIHQKVHEQGKDRVASLCSSGLDRLVSDDICLEGVDFHCSPIIDALLADEQLFGFCSDLIILATPSESLGTQMESSLERRSNLKGVLQTAIWNFSSSVNRRRPLHTTVNDSSLLTEDSDAHAELWNEWIAPRVARFQKQYVEERLAK